MPLVAMSSVNRIIRNQRTSLHLKKCITGVGNIFDYLEAMLDMDIPGVGNYMVIFKEAGLLNGMESFSRAKSFFGLSHLWKRTIWSSTKMLKSIVWSP
jgi:hypothetical protein